MLKYKKVNGKTNMFYYEEREVPYLGIVQMILESVPHKKGDKWRVIYFVENSTHGKCVEFHVYGNVFNAIEYMVRLLESSYGIL